MLWDNRERRDDESCEEYLAATCKEVNAFVERNRLLEKFKNKPPGLRAWGWQDVLDRLPAYTPAGSAFRRYGINPEISRVDKVQYFLVGHPFGHWPSELRDLVNKEEYLCIYSLYFGYCTFIYEWVAEKYEEAIALDPKLSFWDFILTYRDLPQPQPWDAVLGGGNAQPRPWDAVLGRGISFKNLGES